MSTPETPPPNFTIGGYAARRLVQIKAQMEADLNRRVTYTQVIERLLTFYDEQVPA